MSKAPWSKESDTVPPLKAEAIDNITATIQKAYEELAETSLKPESTARYSQPLVVPPVSNKQTSSIHPWKNRSFLFL